MPVRSSEQVLQHYKIEKELASKLRQASPEERRILYSSLYDELYRKVPHHPQLMRKSTPADKAHSLKRLMALLNRFLGPESNFMEIGPGDCALSFAVSEQVRMVFAIDVSKEITKTTDTPANFRLLITDGTSIPVPNDSIHVAYSNQLMEHLHPDDALDQLKNIWRALAPGGCYICITPNKITGPHDISRGFDLEATGFHLKEYTALELSKLFDRVGFKKKKLFFVSVRGHHLRCPIFLIFTLEKSLLMLPETARSFLLKSRLLNRLLAIHIVGKKK